MKTKKYYDKLGEMLISSVSLQNKVKEIANAIEKDYPEEEVILICILNGGFRFLSDLVSYLNIPVKIDFIACKSYEGDKSSEQIKIVKDLAIDIKDRNVIIIEDIIDTGRTMNYIIKHLNDSKSPKTVKVCTLLDKASARTFEVPIDYKGFEIDDLFVVGYGLDYKEYFRELNDIYILKDKG